LLGRLVNAAMRVMEMDDVLEAKIACGGVDAFSAWKIFAFTSSLSAAACVCLQTRK
jgi:hypothetical protein